jgi:hypothetical protein
MDSAAIIAILKRAFDLYLRDFLVLIVAAFIVGLLTPLTLGVLGGPLLAGLYRMVGKRLYNDQAPEIAELFYFERFFDHLLAFYVLAILIAVGFALLILPGLYLLTIWLFAFPLLVQHKLPLGEAMAESKRIADRVGLPQQFATALVLALIGAALSSVTGGIGSLVFAPFSVAYVLVALEHYREQDPEVT